MAGLVLNAVAMGLGMHPGAWRQRDGSPFDYTDLDYYAEIARLAEQGRLHAMFLADTLAVSEENFERPNLGAMDPTVVLSALASITTHLGLVATASSTYNEPYNLARRISSLDHLSRGRAAWNIVTTFVPDVAANFGDASLPKSEGRYQRAEEFVDVVIRLWESWQDTALIGDKAAGRFADGNQVQPIDHHGEFYNVRGPSTLPRTRQVRPLLFQAGSSDAGRQLASRVADVIFTAQNTLAAAQDFYADIQRRVAGFGRAPGSLKVLPGLIPILGGTEAEARARKDELDEIPRRRGVPLGRNAAVGGGRSDRARSAVPQWRRAFPGGRHAGAGGRPNRGMARRRGGGRVQSDDRRAALRPARFRRAGGADPAGARSVPS